MHGRISKITSVRNSELFSQIEQDAEVVRYHSLVVDQLPSDLRATAWTSPTNMDDDPIIMALEHVSRPQYGVQFHPESVKTPLGRQLLSNFRDITKRHRKGDNYGSIEESMMNSSYGGQMISSYPSVDHNSPTIKYEDYLTGFTVHGLESVQHRVKSAAVRYVHVTSIPLLDDASSSGVANSITTEEVFEALYSNCSAAFWLDSQSPLRSSFTMQTSAASSGSSGDWVHPRTTPRLSYMGALDTDYSCAVEYHGHHQLIQRNVSAGIQGHSSHLNTSIFQFLRGKFAEEAETDTRIDRSVRRSFGDHVPSTPSKLPFDITGAFFGYLGYEVGHEAMSILSGASSSQQSAGYDLSIPSSAVRMGIASDDDGDDSSTPQALLLYPSRYVVYDHECSTYHIVSFVESRSNNCRNNDTFLREEATRLGEELANRLETMIETKRKVSCKKLSRLTEDERSIAADKHKQSNRLVAWKTKTAYKNDIATCLENIAAGETYEVCLTLQFTGPLRQLQQASSSSSDRSVNKYIDTYKDLRKYNPAPYACYIQYQSPRIGADDNDDNQSVGMPVDANSFAICCTSPECFLKLTPVRGHTVTRPWLLHYRAIMSNHAF